MDRITYSIWALYVLCAILFVGIVIVMNDVQTLEEQQISKMEYLTLKMQYAELRGLVFETGLKCEVSNQRQYFLMNHALFDNETKQYIQLAKQINEDYQEFLQKEESE